MERAIIIQRHGNGRTAAAIREVLPAHRQRTGYFFVGDGRPSARF
jgi:hypothetical protein